jgi:predicted nucleic acid-binding protein
MMRVSFDTNMLIYAVSDSDPDKQRLAQNLIGQTARLNGLIVQQVYGEFFNYCARKKILGKETVLEQVAQWQKIFPPVATAAKDHPAAFDLAHRYQLQFWDALILHVAASAGVDTIFSEDMQNGFSVRGLQVINPFDPINQAFIQTFINS